VTSTFLFLKTLHIICAAILFGTGVGTAFFCWFGYRHALKVGEIAALRSVLRLTVIADAVFTAPAVLLQATTGIAMMLILGWPLTSAWALSVFALFVLTGVCWLPVVWLQIQLNREAQKVASIAELTPMFHRRFRLWFVLGVPAFIAVMVLYYLMVAKPLSIATG